MTDVPVRIFDLTRHGCLVEMTFGALSGDGIRLQIDLPGEGWTVVHCDTLHIAGHNAFAVSGCSSSERAARAARGRSASREEGRSG